MLALLLATSFPGPAAVPGLPPLQEPNRSALVALLAEGGVAEGTSAEPAAPDWPALLRDPAAAQGRTLLLRGRYAGRQRAADAGGVPLTEWGVVAAVAGEDLPVVVYLPRRSAPPPHRGAEVAGVARFLTLWSDADAAGNPRSYPVFVARDLRPVDPPAAGRAAWIPGLTAAAVALSAVAWFLARRSGRRTPRPARIPRAHTPTDAEGFHGVDPAPADPAEALARLADRSVSPHDRGDTG